MEMEDTEPNTVRVRLIKHLRDIDTEDKNARHDGWYALDTFLSSDEVRTYLIDDSVACKAHSYLLKGLIASIRRELHVKKKGAQKGGKRGKTSFRPKVASLVQEVALLAMKSRPTLRRFILLWQPLPLLTELVSILQEPLPENALAHLYISISHFAPFFRLARAEVVESLFKACERDREQFGAALARTAFGAFVEVMGHVESISQNFVRDVGKRFLEMPDAIEHLSKLVLRWPLILPPNLDQVLGCVAAIERTKGEQAAAIRLGCMWATTPSREVQRLLQVAHRIMNGPDEDSMAEMAWILELVNSGVPTSDEIIERFVKGKNRPPLRIVAEALRTSTSNDYTHAFEAFLRTPAHVDTQDVLKRIEENRRMCVLDIISAQKPTYTNTIEAVLLKHDRIPSLERFLQLCLGCSDELARKAVDYALSEYPMISISAYKLLCRLDCPNIETLLTPILTRCQESMSMYEMLNSPGYLWLATRLSFHSHGFDCLKSLWAATSFADPAALHLANALVCYGFPSTNHFQLVAEKLVHTLPTDSIQWLPLMKAAIQVFHGEALHLIELHQLASQLVDWVRSATNAEDLGVEAKIVLCQFFGVLFERSGRASLREAALEGLIGVGREAVFHDANPEVSLRCAQSILKTMMNIVEDPEDVIAELTNALGPPFGTQEWTLAQFGLCIEYLLAVDQPRKCSIVADMMQAAEQNNEWERFLIAIDAVSRRRNTTRGILLEPLKLYLVGHWSSMGASIDSFPWERLGLKPTIYAAKSIATQLADEDFATAVGAKVYMARSAFSNFDHLLELHGHKCVAFSVTLALELLHPSLSDYVPLSELSDAYDRILKTTFSRFMCLHFKYVLEQIDPILKRPDPLGVCSRVDIVAWLQDYVGHSETNARCLINFCVRHQFSLPAVSAECLLLPAANCSTVLTKFSASDLDTMKDTWPKDWHAKCSYTQALDSWTKEVGNSSFCDDSQEVKKQRREEDALDVLDRMLEDQLDQVPARIAAASFAKLYNRTLSTSSTIPTSMYVFLGQTGDIPWFAWCLWWLNGRCLTDVDPRVRAATLCCLGGLMCYHEQVTAACEWWTQQGNTQKLDTTCSLVWYQGQRPPPYRSGSRPCPIQWSGWEDGAPKDWVCTVVKQLCQRDHRVVCVPLVSVCPDFAEALLPFVWDLSVDGADVSSIIVASSTKDPAICHMMLRALQFARVDAISAKEQSSVTRWAANHPSLQLLNIGVACVEMEEPLEALIYSEIYLQRKYGSLTSPSGEERIVVQRAHRLLAEPPDYDVEEDKPLQRDERRLDIALALRQPLRASYLSSNLPLTTKMRMLRNFGEYHLMRHMEYDLTCPELVDARAESMWRLGDWSQLSHYLPTGREGFHTNFHRALCDKAVPVKAIKTAYTEYKTRQCDALTTCVHFRMCHDATRINVRRWAMEEIYASRHTSIRDNELTYQALEATLSLRHVLAHRDDPNDDRCAIPYVRLCRKARRLEMGLRVAEMCTVKSVELQWEEAQCLWMLGEKTRAIHMARQVVRLSKAQHDPPCAAMVLAKRFGRTAKWLQELAQINNAAEELFKEAKKFGQEYPKVLYWVASFYDQRFLSFSTGQRYSVSMDENELLTQMIDKGKTNLRKKSDLMTAKDTCIYEQALQARNEKLATYMLDVVHAYGDCLVTPTRKYMNVVASRFITLWFKQVDFLHDVVSKYLDNMQFKQLLPFFPQIVGSISSAQTNFQCLLRRLVVNMCIQFPFETLFPTVCLLYQRYVNQETFGGRQGANYVADSKKEEGARMILEQVAQRNQHLHQTVEAVKVVALFYHELADQKVSAGSARRKTTQSLQHLPSYKNAKIQACFLPPITASPSNALMAGLPVTYRHVGSGLSCPSILEVRDTAGVIHKQLVKGKDDLRQDMVVQQLFEQLNQIFLDNGVEGRLRTYKVVPLSPSSGVCEFVEGAISLGDYIVSARSIYHPADWSQGKCVQTMLPAVAKQNKVPLKKKLDCFQHILGNTHPVLHLFFYEYFQDPQKWFQAKQNFRMSVAVSSMVGYIIGLGDRHLQNILIDPKSGEVVHIDFGMTFDYGKSHQGIPELVPFRLTRDISSALGPMGINHGGFRKYCEDSMRTMRDYSEVIMAIVEVFVNDPMVRWCNVVREEQNGMARLAVLGVRLKLQGVDEDSTIGLSVDTLVERLLNRAIDNTLLCQMFQGWAPWC